jgi:Fe-S-cluster-containing hydrogenase component 2
MRIFSSLPDPAVAEISLSARVVQLEAGQRLKRPAGQEPELYYFVAAGQVVVTLRHFDNKDTPDPGKNGDREGPLEYLFFFSAGDFFSDAFISVRAGSPGDRIDCMAQAGARLLGVPLPLLVRLMKAHPDWTEQLARHNTALRAYFQGQQLLSRKIVMDFFLRHGYSFASTIRVTQLDRCMNCNNCSRACEKRHGLSKFSRLGPQLGRLAFPSACLSCTQPRCLEPCRFEAIARDARGGEVHINDRCVGCGRCARACPNDAISIVANPYTAKDFPRPMPDSDRFGQSNVSGLYIVGDAAGENLLRPRIDTGKRAAGKIAAATAAAKTAGDSNTGDVIIVGASPAGLSAALACQKHQLRFLLFDTRELTNLVLEHPAKGKIIRETKLKIRSPEEVLRLGRDNDGFEVETVKGRYHSRFVILAVGERGAPGTKSPTELMTAAGVRIIEPGTPEMDGFAASRGTRKVAIKCDHCAGYDDRACTQACPTGALIETTPGELFVDPRPGDPNERDNFSPVAFMEGIREQRALRRGKRRLRWLGWTALLIIVAVGIECFLRRTMPELSLHHMWSRLNGDASTVSFVSTQGLGHWLGYLGTVLMLLTLVYPLHSRLGWFKLISKRAWLAIHMWVGLAGAAFVTYHSLFKMDRWVVIALVATWLVVLSGAVGRYVYSWVHSGIGLAEFTKQSMEEERQRLGLELGSGLWEREQRRTDAPRGFMTGLLVMMWQDYRERAHIWWVKHFGLQHIEDKSRRRQIARLLADRARNHRIRRYLETARKLLSVWNLVHLVVVLVMLVCAGLHIYYAILYTGV